MTLEGKDVFVLLPSVSQSSSVGKVCGFVLSLTRGMLCIPRNDNNTSRHSKEESVSKQMAQEKAHSGQSTHVDNPPNSFVQATKLGVRDA